MTTLYGSFDSMVDSLLVPPVPDHDGPYRCADLFCGIGGFHLAAGNLGMEVVFACDIDGEARRAYKANFSLHPKGDITTILGGDVPDHDLLFAGFPCQPFSIIGRQEGFADPRGSLFFEALRIISAKLPQGVVLENVKQLATADGGKVLNRIVEELGELGYKVDSKVLNALDFGLPQKRERTIIVGTQHQSEFPWPKGGATMQPLADILEPDPSQKHFVSQKIRDKRHEAHTAKVSPSIWHENKAGNISSHPWSCALRAGASHNYLLVDGERRLTARECLRLQGFPDDWQIVCNDAQTRKQAGNAVPVPMVQAVINSMARVLDRAKTARQ